MTMDVNYLASDHDRTASNLLPLPDPLQSLVYMLRGCFNISKILSYRILSFRDGIHQIVSRFLERFRYMCPLLFSCVFPS
jgi:hypothetical protein